MSLAQLYSSGNNTITGGNVGIGTNNPLYSLDIRAFNYYGNGIMYPPISPFNVEYIGRYGESFDALFVHWGGNVGMGTKNPIEKLHVIGNAQINGFVKSQTGTGYIKMYSANSSYAHFITDRPKFYFNKKLIIDEGIISSYNEDLYLQTQGTTRLGISKSNGDVTLYGGNLILRGGNSNTPGANEIKLKNDGSIRARRIDVDLAYIADYVFKEDYNLMPLPELKEFIEKHKHLPNVKSEKEFLEEGSYNLGEMNVKLLEKVEELTLYILDLQKQIDELKK